VKQNGIAVSVLCDGRSAEETYDAIGAFSRYIPIECQVEPDYNLVDVLETLNKLVTTAQTWQEYFTWEEKELSLARLDQLRQRIGFDYLEWPDPVETDCLSFSLDRLHCCMDLFKLRLSCIKQEGGLCLQFHFDSRSFSKESINRVAQQYQSLLAEAAARPSIRLSELSLVGEQERRLILSGFNGRRGARQRDRCVHELLERQAAETPDRVAVVCNQEAVSYRHLDQRAERLACALQQLNACPERLIGVCLERSVDLIVAIMGIWKSGGGYLPLDGRQPQARISQMLRECGVKVAVSERRWAERFRGDGVEVINLDELCEKENVESSGLRRSEVGGGSLAYVIYTSGSTGRPKGVMISHRNVINLLEGLEEDVYEGKGIEVVGLNASAIFDGSVKQIAQVVRGRRLMVVGERERRSGEELLERIEVEGVEVIDCTPVQLRMMLCAGLTGGRAEALKVALVGGEAIGKKMWEEMRGDEGREYYNVYGPTECTVDASVVKVKKEEVSIGRALRNVSGYVIGGGGELAGIGEVGEL
jgi:non-ribosomal peptide synthetase component F